MKEKKRYGRGLDMPDFYFVTSNRGKYEEVRLIFEERGLELGLIEESYPEIQSESLRDIARFSAKYCAEKFNRDVLVEDSGLFIRALRGFPGPYSSYILKTISLEGILKLMEGVKDRSAYFQACVGFCSPGKEPEIFSGYVEGRISEEIRGEGGFGYDPIFLYGDRTFAEMSKEEKNKVSHRRKAFESFLNSRNTSSKGRII